MYALRIVILIALSLAFLLATACSGFVFLAGGGSVALLAGVLFLLIFLALVREVRRSLLKGDT